MKKENELLQKLLQEICQAIVDKKGMNVLALDVKGVSTITDYFVIAEGDVDRHVKALAKTIIDVAEKKGVFPIHVEGLEEGDWIVLDFLDIIVHLFLPELRGLYSLEEVWKKGKVKDIPVDYGRKSKNHEAEEKW